MKKNYVDNMYAWLTRKGLAGKYEHAGIYCIKLDNRIVYIGKSTNMLKRIAQHYVGIKQETEHKYQLLAQMQREGHPIGFDVLYYASSTGYSDTIEEIGYIEGVYLRQYRPALNTQIPKVEDWHKFEVKPVATEDELRRLLAKRDS